MNLLRYTLISEGTTDANLIPIINWTIQNAGQELVEGYRAEFWRLSHPPSQLAAKIVKALELYPSDALFVHRDSDNLPPAERHSEIFAAMEASGLSLPAVAVVPVRMLKAWFLIDEKAIRDAAGNPNGSLPLQLPALNRIEGRPDPKGDLRSALRAASELTGRRLKKFNDSKAFWRVVECMRDFSSLRNLSAFQSFESAVKMMVNGGFRPGIYGNRRPTV